jgi:hypothetical protein
MVILSSGATIQPKITKVLCIDSGMMVWFPYIIHKEARKQALAIQAIRDKNKVQFINYESKYH